MASGLPVIVSNQGGPGELLRDERDGEVAATGDVAAWVTAVERQILRGENSSSREERRERTIAGRSWRDAFTSFWRDGLL